MYWADKIAKAIGASKKYKPYWVDDMKTPSGYAHVGSLRGPIIHSLIYRALKDAGAQTTFTFVINDFDPADELPPEFKEELKQYLGFPLRKVPSPVSGHDSLGSLLADDFIETFRTLGVEAEIVSSWDLYQEGKFDEVIRQALDSAEKIQDIYRKVSGSAKREKGWLPLQVICENCGRVGTTRVFEWDGKEVSYKCEPDLVVWAKGCGHEGKISPFGGNGKLPWKVDWAAHWKVIGVTIEAAGKDHASAGGSYDIALTLCDEVFGFPRPFNFGYEFFLIGGKKMSSSKGLGQKAHDIVKILPPEIARFLFSRTDYRQAIDFEPVGTWVIPDLFDEYDKARQAFIEGGNPDLARTFELAQIKEVPSKEKMFLPRFRDVVNYTQFPDVVLEDKFAELKGEELTKKELEILKERKKYAEVWLTQYAPDEAKFRVVRQTATAKAHITFSKEFLVSLIEEIEKAKNPEDLEKGLYELIKKSGQPPKKVFAEIYTILIGKTFGPKAAWLIWENKEKALEIFKGRSK